MSEIATSPGHEMTRLKPTRSAPASWSAVVFHRFHSRTESLSLRISSLLFGHAGYSLGMLGAVLNPCPAVKAAGHCRTPRRFRASVRSVVAGGTMLLALLGSPVARAASPSDFEAANQMYDRGDFQGAKNSYESLVHAGSFSANLFYNLGNADYRLGKKGDAFVAYERALALLPSHPEAKANLNLLRNETGALLPTVNWQEQALSWPTEVTGNRAEWLAAAAFWVFCFSLAPLFYKRRVAWIPATLSLLVLGWCGVALRWQQSRGETWIVKSPETSARVSPADTSKMAAALPVGSHVQLLLERGEWLYVLLPNENGEARGWISRAAVDPVAIRKS